MTDLCDNFEAMNSNLVDFPRLAAPSAVLPIISATTPSHFIFLTPPLRSQKHQLDYMGRTQYGKYALTASLTITMRYCLTKFRLRKSVK